MDKAKLDAMKTKASAAIEKANEFIRVYGDDPSTEQSDKDAILDRVAHITSAMEFLRKNPKTADITDIFDPLLPAFNGLIAALQKPKHLRLPQTKPTNILSVTMARRDVKHHPDNTGRIQVKDFRLKISEYCELGGVRDTAVILLDLLMIKVAKNEFGNRSITLSLKEYMEIRGLSDAKSARELMRKDASALFSIHFEYLEKKSWVAVNIASAAYQYEDGNLIFNFTPEFYEAFKYGKSFMWMNHAVYKINQSYHPWSKYLYRSIVLHKRRNPCKPNEHALRVRTLLKSCPNFPSAKQIKAKKRGWELAERIIEPFERDMNSLRECLSWNYRSGVRPATFDEWLNATIDFELKGYPDNSALVEKRKARTKRLAKLKEAKGLPKE